MFVHLLYLKNLYQNYAIGNYRRLFNLGHEACISGVRDVAKEFVSMTLRKFHYMFNHLQLSFLCS